jgi:hypothetical protein
LHLTRCLTAEYSEMSHSNSTLQRQLRYWHEIYVPLAKCTETFRTHCTTTTITTTTTTTTTCFGCSLEPSSAETCSSCIE